MSAVENDCEDQGFSLLSDGCTQSACLTWEGFGNSAKPVRPQLVRTYRHGNYWWMCPKCEGSYGEAP